MPETEAPLKTGTTGEVTLFPAGNPGELVGAMGDAPVTMHLGTLFPS